MFACFTAMISSVLVSAIVRKWILFPAIYWIYILLLIAPLLIYLTRYPPNTPVFRRAIIISTLSMLTIMIAISANLVVLMFYKIINS